MCVLSTGTDRHTHTAGHLTDTHTPRTTTTTTKKPQKALICVSSQNLRGKMENRCISSSAFSLLQTKKDASFQDRSTAFALDSALASGKHALNSALASSKHALIRALASSEHVAPLSYRNTANKKNAATKRQISNRNSPQRTTTHARARTHTQSHTGRQTGRQAGRQTDRPSYIERPPTWQNSREKQVPERSYCSSRLSSSHTEIDLLWKASSCASMRQQQQV